VGLDDIARELRTTDPAEFIAARDRAAREADEDVAREIKKLRKPTLAAWAVNLLAARQPDELEGLLELGERLRAAQRELRGDDLRELAVERTRLLRAVTARAVALAAEAGHELGDTARDQVERTLTAALSDPEAAASVRSAHLAKPLEYSGFGLDELAAASIRRSPEPKRKPGTGAEVIRLRNKLREREERAAEAETELQRAEEEHRAAERVEQRLREELAEAAERLSVTGEELRVARENHQDAQRAREEAVRELDRERPTE
jgi:DNA repair exonuclease SbcCD ATPase subunit